MKSDNQPTPTLGQLHTEPYWFWLVCKNPKCMHRRPMALAPWIIRWGPDAPSDWLRTKFRCEKCGELGSDTIHPSWSGRQLRWTPFPVDGKPEPP